VSARPSRLNWAAAKAERAKHAPVQDGMGESVSCTCGWCYRGQAALSPAEIRAAFGSHCEDAVVAALRGTET
jgi:hypothetical protein